MGPKNVLLEPKLYFSNNILLFGNFAAPPLHTEMRKAFGSVWTVGTGQKTTQYCMNTSSPSMLNIRDTSVTFALSFAPHETLSEITNHPDIEKNEKELTSCQIN